MAVPNTTDFTLQEIVNEIHPTVESLQGCVDDAIASGYDATYYTAPATSQLEFRNYSHSIYKAFRINPSGALVEANICNDATTHWYYHNGVAALPKNTDTVYSTPGGTIFGGLDLYFSIGTFQTMRVSDFGIVSERGICTAGTYLPVELSTKGATTASFACRLTGGAEFIPPNPNTCSKKKKICEDAI